MQRLRSFYSTQGEEKISEPTTYATAFNQHEMNCGVCGETYYLNDLLYDHIRQAIEETADNPFICHDCETEFAEYANAA